MNSLAFAAAPPILDVTGLDIAYRDAAGWRRVVQDVSFTVGAGEVVALVGESGSGKTTTAQAVIGLLPDNGRIERGAIRLNGTDIAHWADRRLDHVRGKSVSLVPQDPGTSLNPVLTIGAQTAEILRLHGVRDGKERRQRVIELLARVGLDQPELRYGQYPHELSGGMKQRVLIAIAIALRPALLIADEPTSALDVTVQRRILDLIDELRAEFGTSVLLVTHDLGVAADRADRIIVLKQGQVQEQGPARQVLGTPRSDYTKRLLADAPSLAPAAFRTAPAAAPEAIAVAGLTQDFPVGSRNFFRAVDDLSFTVAAGTTHAIVGESGSGKTTTARTVVGFQRPTSGRVTILGTEITALSGEPLRQFRRNVQLVYQNPFASLDPRQSVSEIIGEPLRNFEPVGKAERLDRVKALLDQVGLPADTLDRSARALSGGQRQRVAIARALILEPRVLVLDEAVSALDVTVQAQILRLLQSLQDRLGLTYLFVTHDLAVVRQVAHTVTVMQAGRAVETGTVETVFTQPSADYTRELIAAIPGRHLSTPARYYAGAAQ
ncbi:ABC transporter ATP-binding protein [Devosia neptuniae]|uniref:ABC transporter ATP-binding protein n=1 Tax=Devosia neptuniae TaxID=191302 RepID=A0ABY6CGU3_9HYPH|nr:ABC transporter ATP-binding protein [Devosia neptuniae]UXN70196.1 ABC transporter ATP-binding protein [Devosia neptuniae]